MGHYVIQNKLKKLFSKKEINIFFYFFYLKMKSEIDMLRNEIEMKEISRKNVEEAY